MRTYGVAPQGPRGQPMFEIDERGVWEIYETDELHGQLLDGERHGLWLEVVGETITVSLWAHGKLLKEEKVPSVAGLLAPHR